ncbi:MAG: hemerythrin domain-containing protein [Tepidanaerobacteraceae bacterium]|nr:hemerythrin domain-containing protein [Tepidanaerobacter sp.]HQA60741.1 hemerythrin domain-containing protein [Tepidanaerobacteraceae bacterium]HQE06207.1 hemerythrin domain-containing protein [Tepidanaerobacteraceae bacterium]
MSISLLLKQHVQISEILQELMSIPQEGLAEKAFEISKKIGQLAGVLKFHLQSEDKFLYPKLMKHESSHIRDTAFAFTDEMGNLGEKFEAFKATYIQPKNIKAAPEKFKQDLDSIATALKIRIEREDRKLYPLLDR